MASSNEAGLDLREIAPLSRNILPTRGVAPDEYTGQRVSLLGDYRGWIHLRTSPKDGVSYLDLSCPHSGFRKERLGSFDNRCLRDFVECIGVNVGG